MSCICISCVQKSKNTLRVLLPEARHQYSILEKKLLPSNWENSYTLFAHWRDVMVVKCRQEKLKILELHSKINSFKNKKYDLTLPPRIEAIEKSHNLDKIVEFKQKQCKDIQLALEKSFFESLDIYSNYRNDTPYAYIFGSIPLPVHLSPFQLPPEDLFGIMGHSSLILKLFEKFYKSDLFFHYNNRNSHSTVSIHRYPPSLVFLKSDYLYNLYLPESVVQWKNIEKQDSEGNLENLRSFIIGVSLLLYEISCLYNTTSLTHFISNPFKFLQHAPHIKKHNGYPILDLTRALVEELLKVPLFNALLDHFLRTSGYGFVDDESESSTHSLEDYTMLKTTEDKKLVITEIWEDLKYHLRLLEAPFDLEFN